jgi:hypothetical protein
MKRFVARAVRTENRDSKTVWLGEDEGYAQWVTDFNDAEPHESAADAKEAAMAAPGPWFNKPDLETLEILEVEFTPATESKITLCA